MNVNKVILAGRLTRSPELRYTPSNTAVCELGVATNRRMKNKSTGQWEDAPPVFVDVTAWAGTAEAIAKHFDKGREIYIEGRLELDSWNDKQTNQKRTKLKVTCESFQFVGGRDGQSGDRSDDGWGAQPAATSTPDYGASGRGHNPVDEDDIPFARHPEL